MPIVNEISRNSLESSFVAAQQKGHPRTSDGLVAQDW
jgi:hypothetical protein